jgi:hypothetical protein
MKSGSTFEFGLGHYLCSGFGGPIEGMSMLVPLAGKLLNLGAQVRLGGKVCNAGSFSFQHAEPSFDLIRPEQ